SPWLDPVHPVQGVGPPGQPRAHRRDVAGREGGKRLAQAAQGEAGATQHACEGTAQGGADMQAALPFPPERGGVGTWACTWQVQGLPGTETTAPRSARVRQEGKRANSSPCLPLQCPVTTMS